jgi:hypothetical protein
MVRTLLKGLAETSRPSREFLMERVIELADVEVVAETERGLLCRIGERSVEIPTLLIAPGSEVWGCGDRGILSIPLWLATEHGLAPRSDRPPPASTSLPVACVTRGRCG